MTEDPDSPAEQAQRARYLRRATVWGLAIAISTGLGLAVTTVSFRSSKPAGEECWEEPNDFPSPTGRHRARADMVHCSFGISTPIRHKKWHVALWTGSEEPPIDGQDVFSELPVNIYPVAGDPEISWDDDEHLIVTLRAPVHIFDSKTQVGDVTVIYRAAFDYSIEGLQQFEGEYERRFSANLERTSNAQTPNGAERKERLRAVYREDLDALREIDKRFHAWAVQNISP